jgi:chromosomal replication initiator protein
MDRLPHHTFFVLPAHHRGGGQINIDELISELEYVLRRVVALPVEASPVVEIARHALAQMEELKRMPEMKEVVSYVGRVFSIGTEALLSKVRTQHVAFRRAVAMYLCRTVTHASFPAIGQYFGGRNHSTVIHSFKLIAQRVRDDPEFRRNIINAQQNLRQHAKNELAAAA